MTEDEQSTLPGTWDVAVTSGHPHRDLGSEHIFKDRHGEVCHCCMQCVTTPVFITSCIRNTPLYSQFLQFHLEKLAEMIHHVNTIGNSIHAYILRSRTCKYTSNYLLII